MNTKMYCALILFWLYVFKGSHNAREKRFPASRGFLVYRTVSITQKSCTCAMPFSCSCCQNVIILYTKAEKNFCVNFTYQRNGLNIDVSLKSGTIKRKTVTVYKPFQFCVHVPGCLFSTACINILELNQFPKSITACLRLDIFSKKQLWQINYDCVSISTELPPMPDNATTRIMDGTMMPEGEGMETDETDESSEIPSTAITETPEMMLTMVTEEMMPENQVTTTTEEATEKATDEATEEETEQEETTEMITESMAETENETMGETIDELMESDVTESVASTGTSEEMASTIDATIS